MTKKKEQTKTTRTPHTKLAEEAASWDSLTEAYAMALPEAYAKTLPEGYLKTLESKIKELQEKNESQFAALKFSWSASARKANLCSKHYGQDMQFADGKRMKETKMSDDFFAFYTDSDHSIGGSIELSFVPLREDGSICAKVTASDIDTKNTTVRLDHDGFAIEKGEGWLSWRRLYSSKKIIVRIYRDDARGGWWIVKDGIRYVWALDIYAGQKRKSYGLIGRENELMVRKTTMAMNESSNYNNVDFIGNPWKRSKNNHRNTWCILDLADLSIQEVEDSVGVGFNALRENCTAIGSNCTIAGSNNVAITSAALSSDLSHKWIHNRPSDSFHCKCGRLIRGDQIDKATSDYELVEACQLSTNCWEAWCDFSGITDKAYPKAPVKNLEQAVKDAYALPDTAAVLNTYALAQRAESAQQRAELLHYDGSGNFILQVGDQEVPFELVLVIWRSEIIKRKLEWEKKTRLTIYCEGDYVDD